MGKRRMVWSLEGTVYLRFDREAKLREWKVYSPSSSGRPILVEDETAFLPILEPIPEAKPVPLQWRKDRLGKLVMLIIKRNNPQFCIMIGSPFSPGMYTCQDCWA